jgi:hypothetical protein
VQEIMRSLDIAPPKKVLEVSDGLVYRDFITVGLLVRSLRITQNSPLAKENSPQARGSSPQEKTGPPRENTGSSQRGRLITDNWIYIQEPDVMIGRLQIFNNWSPFLVAEPGTVWLGLEYFCNQSDEIWNLSDARMAALGVEELTRIGIIDAGEVLDSTVLRMEKTYPAYFGTYNRFNEIRDYVNGYSNLFLIGRNGMHRYNNQDHSMLTAMIVVDGIIAGNVDRARLWEVNTEMDYHEEKS